MAKEKMKQTNDPIRVLHLHNYSNWGGNLQHVLLVMQGVNGQEFELLLAAPSEEEYLDRFRECGITVHPFEARSRLDIRALLCLLKLVRKEKIDIVHSHLRRTDWLCYWARFFCPSASFITTVHGEVNRGSDFRRKNEFRSWLYSQVLRKTFRKILTVSRELAEQLHKEEGVADKLLLPVSNGVEIEGCIPPTVEKKEKIRKKLALKESDLVLIQAGRFGRRKGQEILIRAIDDLGEQGSQIKVLFLGDGDDEDLCRNLVKELALEKQVLFFGFQRHINDFYQAADIVTMPSFSEGLPRGLLEGMAYGLCPLASDISGIREAVQAPRFGFTFPAGKVAELTKLLRSLLLDRELVLQTGKKARKRVVEKYTAKLLVSQHETCYRELMNR